MEAVQEPPVLTAVALPPELDPERIGLSPDQMDVFPELVQWLAKKPAPVKLLAQCLLGTQCSSERFVSEMRELVSQLIAELRQDVIDTSLSTLRLLVQFRNQDPAYTIQMPEISVRIPPIANPFTTGRWEGLSRVRRWRDATVEEITRNADNENQQLAYGRILASAVLWGGLVSRSSLQTLYELLPDLTDHCEMEHGRIAVTWAESGDNHKRWLPDALTSLLMLRLLRTPQPVVASSPTLRGSDKAYTMESALFGYFRGDVTRQRNDYPAGVGKLLDAVLLDMEVRIPRVLTQYAAGKQVSHSLRPDTWQRLMCGPVGRKLRNISVRSCPAAEIATEGSPEEGTEIDEMVEPSDGIAWLPDIRTVLKSAETAEKPKALARVRAYLKRSDIPRAARIFAGFAEALLQEHAKSRKGNTLKTLRTRVIAVATRLPGKIRFDQAASLNGDTLQAAYQAVIEEAISENQHQKLANHLRAFHHYLVKMHSVESIDEGETFASGDEDLSVDANLIVEDEYQNALAYLSDGHAVRNLRPADKLVRRVAQLILILGFRCGLRRMEVLKLQLTDLILKHPAELLIRPWEQRRLKTPNATRKMPLYALLTSGELDKLREWYAQRREECENDINPSPFLFSIPGMGYAFLPEGMLFPLIHDALRDATNDPTVHFHHLRHSFASWMVYALMRPPKSPVPRWLDNWVQSKEWMSKSDQLHRDLYGNSFPTRRHLYAISRLLGHSGPEMTLEHYVHTTDLLLALWLEQQMQLFEPKVWIAAAGIPASTAYRSFEMTKEGTASGIPLVQRSWNKLTRTERKGGVASPASERSQESADQEPSPPHGEGNRKEALQAIDSLWLLLYLRATEGTATEDLARRFGFSESLVDHLICVAQETEQRRLGKKSFLHHFEHRRRSQSQGLTVGPGTTADGLPAADGGQPGFRRIACPRKPRESEDLEAVARFAPRLWKLIRRPTEFCHSVLKHYLEFAHDERNALEFQPSEQRLAKEYVGLLRRMGISRRETLLLRYADKGDSVAWQWWYKALHLSGEEPVRAAIPPSVKKGAQNVIGIKIVLGRVNPKTKTSPRASYGTSYLLVMAGIWIEAYSRMRPKMVGEVKSAEQFAAHPQ